MKQISIQVLFAFYSKFVSFHIFHLILRIECQIYLINVQIRFSRKQRLQRKNFILPFRLVFPHGIMSYLIVPAV